jgi:hypothetical protein
MPKENKKQEDVVVEQEPKKQRSIITMATDGQTVTSQVKTTRELYMEPGDVKKD